MKKPNLALSVVLIAMFTAAGVISAQQNPTDAPASKEDIQRYLEVTHSREMMKTMMDVMAKSIREIAHKEAANNRASLPQDAEERINKNLDQSLKAFPVDEVLDAMVPIYQKHWTKGDVDNMIAFYSTATGQKLLNEMPQTMAEGMQAMRPIMEKHMETMRQQIQQQVAELKKEQNRGRATKPERLSN
jgi:hypothetical protein